MLVERLRQIVNTIILAIAIFIKIAVGIVKHHRLGIAFFDTRLLRGSHRFFKRSRIFKHKSFFRKAFTLLEPAALLPATHATVRFVNQKQVLVAQVAGRQRFIPVFLAQFGDFGVINLFQTTVDTSQHVISIHHKTKSRYITLRKTSCMLN